MTEELSSYVRRRSSFGVLAAWEGNSDPSPPSGIGRSLTPDRSQQHTRATKLHTGGQVASKAGGEGARSHKNIMEESRKRAKAIGDNDESGGVPTPPSQNTRNEPPPASEVDAAAAMKIAELQARVEAMRANHELEMDELKAQCQHEVQALQSENEDLKSALEWAYAIEEIPFQHWRDKGHDGQYSYDMVIYLGHFKETIQSLRLGTVWHSLRPGILDISVNFDFDPEHDELLLPYWEEFAAALKHWSKHYAGDKYLEVSIREIEMPKAVLDILRPAFEQSRIKVLSFKCNGRNGHLGDMADFVKTVLQTNHFITEISFDGTEFAQEDVKTICDAIKSRNTGGQFIEHFGLAECSIDGEPTPTFLETQTLQMILTSTTSAGSRKVSLCLAENGMSSREAVVIAEFLSSNPTLTELDLSTNCFEDADASVLANVLSSNTNLRTLSLNGNENLENWRSTFLRAIFDVSSQPSCAASNHTCRVRGLKRSRDRRRPNRSRLQDISVLNGYESISMNKWEKIFAILALSSEDAFMNTTLLQGVPAQLIPMILSEADYGADEDANPQLTDLYLELTNTKRSKKHDDWDDLGNSKSLNCMYELMKSWVGPSIFV